MGTFKKALGIVLAGATLISSAAFSVSADAPKYDDEDKIDYLEAVSVLGKLGVLTGRDPQYEPGNATNFDPDGNLTRAEGCKILVKMLHMDGVVGTSSFDDVPADHWASSEIAYCQREGIVEGYGGNVFGESDELTGSQFAKMLLVAAGYDAQIEGMTGPQWEISVAKLVRSNELDEGLVDYDPTRAIRREEAAQMALNLLMTPIVEYENKGSNLSINGADLTFGASNAKPVTGERASRYSQIYLDRTNDGNNSAFVVEFGEEHWGDLKLSPATYKSANGYSPDEFGRPSRKWVYQGSEIGTYNSHPLLTDTYTKKVTPKDIYDKLGKDVYDSVKNGTTTLVGSIDGYNYVYFNPTWEILSSEYNSAINEYTTLSNYEEWDVSSEGVNMFLPSTKNVLKVSGVTIRDYYQSTTPWGSYDDSVTLASGAWSGYTSAAIGIDQFIHRSNTSAVNNSDNGTLTEVYYDNSNNIIRIVSINTWVFKANSDYNTNRQNVTLSTEGDTGDYVTYETLDYNTVAPTLPTDLPIGPYNYAHYVTWDSLTAGRADFPNVEALRADDYALVTARHSNLSGDYELKSVDKARIVEGTVQRFSSGGSWNVSLTNSTIGGTSVDAKTYDYSATTIDSTYEVRKDDFATGERTKLVLDKYDYIIAVDEVRSSNSYVFIQKIGSTNSLNNTAIATAYFIDTNSNGNKVGRSETITIKEIDQYATANSGIQNVSWDSSLNPSLYYSTQGNDLSDYTVNHSNDGRGYTTLKSKSAIYDAAQRLEGNWYLYSRNSNNEYTLEAVSNNKDFDDYAGLPKNVQATYVYNASTGNKVTLAENNDVYYFADFLDTTSANSVVSGNNYIKAYLNAMRVDGDTVMIVDDGDSINTYTGIKNLPDVILRGGDGVVTAEFDILWKDNGYVYAIVAILDAPNTNRFSASGGSSKNLLYALNYDGKTSTVNGDDAYALKVLRWVPEKDASGNVRTDSSGNIIYTKELEEATVEMDSPLYRLQKTGNKIYDALYKVSENSKGLITSAEIVSDVAGDADVIAGHGLGGHNAISVDGGVITFGDDTWNFNGYSDVYGQLTSDSYSIASDARIVLITLGGNDVLEWGNQTYPTGETNNGYNVNYTYYHGDASELNNDRSADFEYQVVTPKQLENALKGYYYTYNYAGKLRSSSDWEITELYVTVTLAIPD